MPGLMSSAVQRSSVQEAGSTGQALPASASWSRDGCTWARHEKAQVTGAITYAGAHIHSQIPHAISHVSCFTLEKTGWHHPQHLLGLLQSLHTLAKAQGRAKVQPLPLFSPGHPVGPSDMKSPTMLMTFDWELCIWELILRVAPPASMSARAGTGGGLSNYFT